MQKYIKKSIEIFQSYDHKRTAMFLWFTVYTRLIYAVADRIGSCDQYFTF